MYWLIIVLYGASPSSVIIPEKYPNEKACHDAANNASHMCIVAPVIQLSQPLGNGYYCGQYPERCNLTPVPKCVTNINSGKLECN